MEFMFVHGLHTYKFVSFIFKINCQLFSEEIRKYYGESIALYFSFLGFYTTSLFAPAILGILHLFLPAAVSNHSLVFFCVFNLLWVTVFLEVWKRKCSELAYVWGTLRYV